MNQLHRPALSGFTLVETLVAFAILMLLMVVLASMVNSTSSIWLRTRGRIEQFQQAREAFDALTRRLSEATLNTYYDYVDDSGNPRSGVSFVPARYVRQSELRFLSGPGLIPAGTANQELSTTHGIFFQAPLGDSADGLPNLLNTCGFFVAYGSDESFLPSLLPSTAVRKRFRLMQLIEPSEKLSVYGYSSTAGYKGHDWFTKPLASGTGIDIVADNVIALILLPRLTEQDQKAGSFTDASLSPDYTYDSTALSATAELNPKNQLPPIVQVTLVAISEASANRMSASDVTALNTYLSRFASVGDAKNASQPGFAKDLKDLEAWLAGKNISYRVFSSNVTLKAAKWSREQKN